MKDIINVKELRKRIKLTQSALAKECGVDLRTVQNWEKGTKIPEPVCKLLEMIARKYETISQTNTISNTGAFSTNTINGDLGQQLSELISVQKGMQQDYLSLMQEKDRQIKELIEIIKQDKCNVKQ